MLNCAKTSFYKMINNLIHKLNLHFLDQQQFNYYIIILS